MWLQRYQSFTDVYELLHTDKYSKNLKLDFGTIHECRRKYDGKLFACKKIVKSKLSNNDITNEIDILKKIDHKYIPNTHEIYETNNILYIILDELNGEQLYSKLTIQKRFNETDCKSIIKMLCIALDYMYDKHSITHGDLHPNNILFIDNNTNLHVKVLNFCMSQILSKIQSKLQCNKVITNYTAPEIISNRNNYSHLSDMWSIGVITFVIIFGLHPFYIQNKKQNNPEQELKQFCKLVQKGFQNKIKNGFGPFFPASMSGILSKNGMDFISKLLTTKMNKRINAKDALDHVWLKDVVLKDYNKILNVSEIETNANKIIIKRQLNITHRKGMNIKHTIGVDISENDEIFTVERVKDALQNNDKNEIIEMFTLLLEQNKEYQQKIKKLEKDNIALENVIQTVSESNQLKNERFMDQSTVMGDLMTPMPTSTPVRTNVTPINGIDL